MKKSEQSKKVAARNQGAEGTVEAFTPQEAAHVLKHDNYEDNRPIAKAWVDYLARQIEGGLWKMNGEPLIFDGDGKLLDGQHRLAAIAKSGKTVPVMVVRGIDTDTFSTMDQGRNRSSGQVFRMREEKHSHLLSAICRKVYGWEVKGVPRAKGKVSPDELWLVLAVYGDELRSAAQRAIEMRRSVPIDGSTIGFCYFLFKQARPRKAEAFFETLSSGVPVSGKRDAACVLRDRLFREATKHRRWRPDELFALIVRAWNHYDRGALTSRSLIKPDKDGNYKIPAIRGLGRGQGSKGQRGGGSKDFKKAAS